MKLIISFSGRSNGNSNDIAQYISRENDLIINFKDLNIHSCMDCNYECFKSVCKYREDDIYKLYEMMYDYDKVVLIVPMYCNNPSSLYFIFNERSQDFFMHNGLRYEELMKKLYIIGILGSKTESPNFLKTFNKWFFGAEEDIIAFNKEHVELSDHILGIERHLYDLRLSDSVINIPRIREKLDDFLK